MVHAWIFISMANTLIHSPNLHNYSMQRESSEEKKKKFEWTKETKQKNQNRNPATFHTLECSDNENTTNNNNNNKSCVARVFEHKWFPLHKYTLKVASFVNCAAILGCNSSRIFIVVVVVVVLFKYERFLSGLLFVIYFWLFFYYYLLLSLNVHCH